MKTHTRSIPLWSRLPFFLIVAPLALALLRLSPGLAEDLAGEFIPWSVVSGGGGGGNGGSVALQGTVGQPAAGFYGSAAVDIGAGFWYDDNPTSVILGGFDAESFAGYTTLAWQTLHESDFLGFNLYRCAETASPPDVNCARLNAALIPPKALGQPVGANYSFVDSGLPPGNIADYWLEIVSLDGGSLAGPLQVSGTYGLRLPLILRSP